MIAETKTAGGTYGMVKKARKHPSKLRRDDRTPGDLREGAVDLRRLASKLDTFAEALEELKLKQIEVDSVTKLERGTTLIVGFLKAVEKAIVDVK